jgi:hypothetical protein
MDRFGDGTTSGAARPDRSAPIAQLLYNGAIHFRTIDRVISGQNGSKIRQTSDGFSRIGKRILFKVPSVGPEPD